MLPTSKRVMGAIARSLPTASTSGAGSSAMASAMVRRPVHALANVSPVVSPCSSRGVSWRAHRQNDILSPSHSASARAYSSRADDEDSDPPDYASSSPKAGPPPPSDSIFSPDESAWDHVFDDISDTLPPTLPARSPSSQKFSRTAANPRRQAMTAREISAFDEMFNMIFNAANARKAPGNVPVPGEAVQGTDIGRGTDGAVSDLFSRLRKRARTRHALDDDAALDRKKEEMELCDSDYELLVWAEREVFGESQRAEADARAALAAGKAGVLLQPPAYPHLLALLIRAFRDKYRDPHLALAIFEHARRLSIPSYVFGCTTPAYNELLETRWGCFRDLRGVHDALEEMRVNGVPADARTRSLAEEVRREVGERNLWMEESEVGSGEVWAMLSRIERLVSPTTSSGGEGSASLAFRDPNAPPVLGAWKNPDLQQDGEGDGLKFGEWPTARPDRAKVSYSTYSY